MDRRLTAALDYALSRGFQIHPDAFRMLQEIDVDAAARAVKEAVRSKSRGGVFQILVGDLEEGLGLGGGEPPRADLGVLFDPTPAVLAGGGSFRDLFASRYEKLRRIISARPEAAKLRQIGNLKEEGYVCGLVSSKSADKKIARIGLEDPSGTIEGAVFEGGPMEAAGSLLVDQVVMARVTPGQRGGVIQEIVLPEVPNEQGRRSSTEEYAVFLSDLHVGSRYFMEEEFSEFVSWLSGPDPVARRVRFVLVCGDVVDGVGIYPGQDRELEQQTAEEQLARADELLGGIPSHVRIVVAPGNHDPGRRALPQPAIPRKYAGGLWERENVVMVGNPATVSLNGVRVAMFHGQSIDDIVKTTPGLSYDSPVGAMRLLLRARHVCPTYGGQTPVAPGPEDLLVLEGVPDVFHVGHVHKMELGAYRGASLVNSGSWQRQTPFQASVGMVPNPGIAVLLNLKTFKFLLKDFGGNSDEILQY
ncbi:MAG: DNA-directed DNA polymerase II small subunit [Nitrosopumilus sp.]|nr:DNA-directed DNA polymerase II small subunit [Nitrosopumilus sp.]CAI9830821.1 DNA polymerase II small subunit [Nitrosopumilaceae archaeon]MDA7944515.1 DNA-directed DNA polymerase II small subunit [Nitrosopumilus sp.]MDA7952594.1 DNA-directed DNA polymerase II small subunit [Nitrosopumilus sp.]MDA7954267.1 DNA-directed DNA polymerase II small subunit [Nitrosopumilus sp.]